ncbi:MAG: hypothetical protein QOI46_5279, partial [Alphaproteobacteria bacterium]|nr:hypothetical protein [Alphaproteobacteria bacterium]
FPEKARIAQVDIRAAALGNRCALDLGVIGTVSDTVGALLPLIHEKTDSAHLDEAVSYYRRARADLDGLAESGPRSKVIHPQYLNRVVSELADDDAIFSCDVGTPTAWAARYLKMNGRRRLIGSFLHGSMANAMPQAIGAQAAFPGRQVISLSGDGGFAMMMGEFVTLLQTKLPVKIIVLNNGTLGFVEIEMKAFGFLDANVDLKNPNFAEMARAMGIKGVRVEKPQDVYAAVQEVLQHDGPALLDVVTARQELVMPPTTTFEEAHKFGMFMLKAVLDGRASELIDLAKVNLTR